MIIHEHNEEEAVHCTECNTDTNIYRLIETIFIQQRRWCVLEFYCIGCTNSWVVWGGSIPVGGDVFYALPYTWAVEQDAS